MTWAGPPIYPFPLKPKSGIVCWGDWPDEVVDAIRRWNGGKGGHRLSFHGSHGVFKCPRCEQFCEPDTAACILDGAPHCDECVMALAREEEMTAYLDMVEGSGSFDALDDR